MWQFKRSRHQYTREQQYFYWQEDVAVNVYRHTCALPIQPQHRTELQHRIQDDFKDRVDAADRECWRCNTAEHTHRLCYHQQPTHMPAQMLTPLCTSHTLNVPAAAPALLCLLSAKTVFHPLHARPQSHDQQLLAIAEAAQHSGLVSIQAHRAALKHAFTQEASGPKPDASHN